MMRAFPFLITLVILTNPVFVLAQNKPHGETVVIKNNGWELKGDLVLAGDNSPVVIMLNKANGDRKAYAPLASQLAKRGISSLRIDLRGHGESINKGKFIPFDSVNNNELKMDSTYTDIVAAHDYLLSLRQIDINLIGIVGASYSGEDMMVASRKFKMAKAYVALSPGSFSEESIENIDLQMTPMLFIKSNDEKSMQGFEADVFLKSKKAKFVIVSGKTHATDILQSFPEINTLIADWLQHSLVK